MPQPASTERIRDEQQRLAEAGVEYCVAAWSDIHGRSKAKVVPVGRFEKLAHGSEMYTAQAFEGMGDLGPHVPDQNAVPDLDSLVICPWDRRVAWMAADLYWRGEPYEFCSRSILKRQVARAAEHGYAMMLGVEPEFYVLRETADGRLEPLSAGDEGPCWAYDVEKTLDSLDFLAVLARYVDELGWEMHSYDHEGGHGQFELDFGFTDVLAMCDRFVFLRLMLKEVAKRFGAFATFMPKPSASDFRSGSHYNMSLVDLDGANVMADESDPAGVGFSAVAYSFVAGLLEHYGALMAVCCPTVNSYKGFVTGGIDPTGTARDMSWAPIHAAYGDNNRAAMLRLPNGRPCVENRTPDMSHNPYWGAALSLGAGLEGVMGGLDPGAPANRNLYESNGAAPDRPFPQTLLEAVVAFEQDVLTTDVFGAAAKAEFAAVKRREWNEYNAVVTEWERDRYLRFF